MSKYKYQFTNEQLNALDNLNRDSIYGQVQQIGEPLIEDTDFVFQQPQQIGDIAQIYQTAGDTKTALNLAAFQNAVNDDQQNYASLNRQQVENQQKKERLQKQQFGINMSEQQYSAYNPYKDSKAEFDSVIKLKANVDRFKTDAVEFFDKRKTDVRAEKPVDAGYFQSIMPQVETYKKKISDIMTKSDYLKRYYQPRDKYDLPQKRLQPTINMHGQQVFNPVLPKGPTQIVQQAVPQNNIQVIHNQRNNFVNSTYLNKLEQTLTQKDSHDIYNLQNNNNIIQEKHNINRPKAQLQTSNNYNGMNLQRNQIQVNDVIGKKLNPGQQVQVPSQNVIMNRKINNNYISNLRAPDKPVNPFQISNSYFNQNLSMYSNLQNDDRLYGNGSILPNIPPNIYPGEDI